MSRKSVLDEPEIASVRRFNRFYTSAIGTLRERWLTSTFSLTEARVLFEVGHRESPTAQEISRETGLDTGYLSRILRAFERRGLIARKASPKDARQMILSLTRKGRAELAVLDERASDEVRGMLNRLLPEQRLHLLHSMHTIETLLTPGAEKSPAPYVLRLHRLGDMGYITYRNAVIYAGEYGWGPGIESSVARIVADFLDNYDPQRERCWVAEREGVFAGCVFLVKHPDDPQNLARLRLLIVEQAARGSGLGRHLVHECTRFAQQAGYKKITLWTHTVLTAARKIYEREGYKLVHQEPHSSFGKEEMGETWELDLEKAAPRSVGAAL